jgi:hypothetical protein
MTEAQALAFMTNTIVMCEDEDGVLFGVCKHDDDDSGHCVILTPDRRSTYTLAEDLDKEMATAGAIAAIAGAKLPYVDGETALLLAPTTQALNAVYPDEPQWVEDTTSVCLGVCGMYALFSSMDRDALVAAAEGKSNPWVLVA